MARRKTEAAKALADVSEEKAFWCYGGEVFRNLQEMAVALERMSEEAFEHHVTEHKNDFSNWVRDVFGDTTLANQLRKATTKSSAAGRVKARISWLKDRI
ncbi:MAG: hypothetical protein FJ008_01080 [Chloroflexi bacterium]|nr:hypothetical protein [Chloroflexota bacterium]MBM3172146.1 hypothetical protein [Chloroflexota bacterium]MBM3175360.1 hypothetical protein [Chloroflexota bacterium]MBM4450269.1 hypothetical protein [Chloroflexota bacterium]